MWMYVCEIKLATTFMETPKFLPSFFWGYDTSVHELEEGTINGNLRCQSITKIETYSRSTFEESLDTEFFCVFASKGSREKNKKEKNEKKHILYIH